MKFNYVSVDRASPHVATHTSPTVAIHRPTAKRLPAVEWLV